MKQPSYYSIIPANVRYDKDLTANSKLLYGEITSLCDSEGFCWASNEYFANLYQTSERTIIRNLKTLESKDYIEIFYIQNGSVRERYIATDKNVIEMTKMSLGDGQKCQLNNINSNIKEINNNKLLFTKKRKKKNFIKPTLDEVKEYCEQRNSNIDVKRFFDYYEESDWIDSRSNQVMNWKQKVISWERNEKKTVNPDWSKKSIDKKEISKEELPSWFDKNIEEQKTSDDEKEELEKLLKEFGDDLNG